MRDQNKQNRCSGGPVTTQRCQIGDVRRSSPGI